MIDIKSDLTMSAWYCCDCLYYLKQYKVCLQDGKTTQCDSPPCENIYIDKLEGNG